MTAYIHPPHELLSIRQLLRTPRLFVSSSRQCIVHSEVYKGQAVRWCSRINLENLASFLPVESRKHTSPKHLTSNMPHATATVNGVVVAETDNWEVVDGNIYVRLLPPSSYSPFPHIFWLFTLLFPSYDPYLLTLHDAVPSQLY